MSKKIVVLGAGYAGVLTAKNLEKKLRGKNAEITLIDKNRFHTMLSELHEVAAWRVEEESIRLDLNKIFAGRNVNIVLDKIESVDFETNTLTGKQSTYEYDYLVMASGCKAAFFGIEGAEEFSYPLWSYEEAVRLRDHIQKMFRDASCEIDPERRQAMLTFFCIGAGFTGIEMIAELAEYVPIACKKFDIDPKDVRMVDVDIADKILPFFPAKAIDRCTRRLQKLGVELMLGTKVTAVGAESISYEQGGKEYTCPTHTVIWTAGTEGSSIAQTTKDDLGEAPRSRGRIQTDGFLRSIKHPNVYVAGDNIFYVPEGHKEAVPQMVENCERCAPLIAENIASEVLGQPPKAEYKPKFHGSMVSVGGRYASAYVGMPGKFIVLPSFFAMLAKHFVAMLYFMHVLGWTKVFSHIKAQFFTIRNSRSILGGHFSNRAPTFTLVPLRLFMGMFFLYNAYVRIMYDWFSEPVLRNIFVDVSRQFRPAFPIPLTSIYMDFTFWNTFRFSVTRTGEWSTIWFQAMPISWFLETFVVSSPAAEVFWQSIIVIFFVLVGLSLIAGLLTTISALGALFYAVVMLLTVGLAFHSWWLFFAPFAFMFSGGRVLSMDYYVIPWLKERWKRIGFVKKWYLYND